MTNEFDFSKALVRCHALYYIVSDGVNKTPKQKYEYLQSCLAEEVGKYEDMGERLQGMKRGLTKAAKIAGLEQELLKLEPRKHEDPLPPGAKSYLKRLYGYIKYGKWSASKDKGNKYTEKGKLAEPDAIALVNSLDGKSYIKNEQRLENGFITGCVDVCDIPNGYLVDVKASWDWETFAENIGKPSLNPLYWWQMQGYLDLYNYQKGEVSYCLVDTPPSILEGERFHLANRMNAITQETAEYRLAEAILINNLTFSDIPEKERRLKFEVERNEDAIIKIYNKVEKCREYLAEIQEMHLRGVFTDKELPILEEIEEI